MKQSQCYTPCGCPCTTQPHEGTPCLLNEKLVLCPQAESWPGQALDSSSERRMGEEPRYCTSPAVFWLPGWPGGEPTARKVTGPQGDLAAGSKQTRRPKES
ncbi:serine hydroxymethyltransferase, mitochondrial [Platysternon megacephalum]|uniref:Serine hydroxymethyltransferase, mitochondrial n=1 Tax=Platysternon megacephalum TaxID=55544 RepID=A0A4D9EBI4_9SAUR|nr:serine hydroxymethyltransferase, mitochondrial [Platysternon megacephalum]